MRSILLLLISLCLLCLSEQTAIFENASVIKTVDLSKAITKVTLRFMVKPLKNAETEYIVSIPAEEAEHLAYITASNKKNTPLSIKKSEIQDKSPFLSSFMLRENVVLYKVSSKEAITEGFVIFVDYYLTHMYESLPAFASQVSFNLQFYF